MTYKVVIIGSGPAGLTAAIYNGRSKLRPLVIEGELPGGALMTTTAVENWPGMSTVQGPDLMLEMRAQAEKCGAEFLTENVERVDFSERPYRLWTTSGKEIAAQCIIISTGATHRKLDCPGESTYFGRGVAVCATCDAPFYEGKEVVIVGGGNTAVTEADYLTRFAKKITIIQMMETMTATDPAKDRILKSPKVSILYASTVTEILGDGKVVTGVKIKNLKDNSISQMSTDGVFVAIGTRPNTDLFKGQLELDKYGYIKLEGLAGTSKPGIFAAGDVADWKYRQAVTSAGFGCIAALEAEISLTGKITITY